MPESYTDVPRAVNKGSKYVIEKLPLRTSDVVRWLSHFVTISLVAGLGYYLLQNWANFSGVLDLSPAHAALIASCIFATWIVNAAQSTILIRLQNVNSGFWENLLVQNAAILTNYLPMRAGTILRFHYFKAVHGVEYSRLGGMSAMRTVLLFATTGLCGVAGLGWTEQTASASLWLLYIGMVMTALLMYLASHYPFKLVQTRMGSIFERFIEGFRTLSRQPGAALLITALILVQFLILAARLALCFSVMGVSVEAITLLMLAPAATLLSFITITPGNLGLREWVIGALSVATGHSLAEGIFAASLDRSILMASSFLFGGPALWWTTSRMKLRNRNN